MSYAAQQYLAPARFAIPNPAPEGFEKIKSGATLIIIK